ncbi:putative sporulation protein YtxC [Bacillus sp. HMF5848]|uniref:putative sporulation protein YtxC n=1 Tax=Bacillus sp. HMF5848 TaxID=2495421 RepID=UPI00163A4E8D|nr:putative sporulation protein YtxC [Bacillus sp. HMF5848]
MVELIIDDKKDIHNAYAIFVEKFKAKPQEIWCEKIDNRIRIHVTENSFSYIRRYIIEAVTEFITKTKEHQLLVQILQDTYFYEDFEEQQQILHMYDEILEGERDDIPGINMTTSKEELIKNALTPFLQEQMTFSLDSFVKFRLKEYKQRLNFYIQKAIDEYKFEQEYQMFVEQLRGIVAAREPLFEHIHIVFNGHFRFFDVTKREITEFMHKWIDRKMLKVYPFCIDLQVLAPLVSIAPKQIVVYTDNHDHGMIRTIQNIFLERVSINHAQYF